LGGDLVGLEFINARLKLTVVGFYTIVLALEFSTRPSDLKQILFLLGLARLELFISSLYFIVYLRLELYLALNGS